MFGGENKAEKGILKALNEHPYVTLTDEQVAEAAGVAYTETFRALLQELVMNCTVERVEFDSFPSTFVGKGGEPVNKTVLEGDPLATDIRDQVFYRLKVEQPEREPDDSDPIMSV
ncbi:hypothetical protein KJ742_03790 [Patescibacteria group bacterium]|nr:hypothetical protein [Patescibacteria group bacterium]MBU1683044.1 hypothetical protein [Patescibacteria group bacterium]MBU1935115.1 hypothetical protein [Patescibacteria group bacterium]